MDWELLGTELFGTFEIKDLIGRRFERDLGITCCYDENGLEVKERVVED